MQYETALILTYPFLLIFLSELSTIFHIELHQFFLDCSLLWDALFFFLYRMVYLSTFCSFAWQAIIFYPPSYISNQVDNCRFICRWVCTGTWELTLLVCSSFFLVRVDSLITSHSLPVLYKNKNPEKKFHK